MACATGIAPNDLLDTDIEIINYMVERMSSGKKTNKFSQDHMLALIGPAKPRQESTKLSVDHDR